MGHCLRALWIVLLVGEFACRGPTRTNRATAPDISVPDVQSASPLVSVTPGAPERGRPGLDDSAIAAHSRPASLRLGYARPVRQTLACGALGFVRLTEPGFEAYSYATLTRTMRRGEGAFTHVVAQPGYSFLLVGSGTSLLYYQANPRLTPLGHLPALGPMRIWQDAQQRDRVWAHYLKDDAVHHFELPRNVRHSARLLSSAPLPDFDGTQVVRLVGGQWIYRANSEFAAAPRLRLVDGQRRVWLTSGLSAEIVVPGGGMNLWAIDTHRITRHEITPLDQVIPGAGSSLVGETWAAVGEGERLALLSQHSAGEGRRWGVQVVVGSRSYYVKLPHLAGRDSPQLANGLTLCLVPGRTWVVLGDRSDVHIVDYAAGSSVWQTR